MSGRRLTQQQIARLFAHDVVCTSEYCEGRGHADRTQAAFGREAVKFATDADALAEVLHAHLCLGCPNPLAHVDRMGALAWRLQSRLEVTP